MNILATQVPARGATAHPNAQAISSPEEHFSSPDESSPGLSAEHKAQAGFAFALVCLCVIGVTSYVSVNRLRRAAEWSRHTVEVISSLHLLLSRVTDAETSQRGHAITGDEGYLGSFAETQREIDADLQSLRKLTADNAAQQRRLNAIAPLIASRLTRLREAVGLRRSEGFAAVQSVIATGVGKQLQDQIRGLVGEMVTVEQGLLQQREAVVNRSSTVALGIIGSGSILALGVGAVALLTVRKDFARRRAHAVQAALAGRLAQMGAWAVALPEFKLTWSDQVCAILEVPPGFAPTVEESQAYYPPEFRATMVAAFAACERDGTPFDVDSQIITAQGRRVWVRVIGEAERNARGVIRRVQGILQDVTERKRTDDYVKRLAAIVENSVDAIYSMTLDGIITSWNPAAEKMFGYTGAEVMGQPWQMLMPPDRADEETKILDTLARGELVRQFETVRIRKDGQHFDVSATISPIKDSAGRIVGISRIVRDITERKQGLETLRESETRFRELAENIEEVFWVADPTKSRKLYISPAYEKIWGRTCQSAYESPHLWLDSVRPEDRARVLHALRTKQIEGTYDEEYRISRPDGTERWIRDRAFPVRSPGGTIKRWVGVAEDITKYRTLEDQLRQTQKMEAIGTLAGGIAHDFNNILASINGYTELARLVLKENPTVREYLGAVLQASSRAGDLVRQILTFSRQERVERRPIQLCPVVAETLNLLRAAVPSTIEFDIALAADAPTVLANPTQIHQILMNLGTNAWHAMKEHPGKLQVRLERWVVEAEQAGAPARLRPGLYARLSVSDTGCGMDPATQQKIFEPFFTTKPPGEGTGLGLAVVHGIMDIHDGAITVQSEPGQGTAFQLYFPAHAGEATVEAAKEGPVPGGHGERILFIDDEELLAQLGQKTLTALGYEVEIATQPAAAIAMVRADPQRFALVLTDQTMPGMTGFLLAAQLRQIQPGLPVILITGYTLPLTAKRAEAAGICQLLLKPTSIHSLGMAVHAVLSSQPAG